MIQKGLFAVGFPAAISLFVISGFLLFRRPSLQPWAVPAAALLGIGLSFIAQFHDFSGIGSRWERWKWIVPASAAVLVIWPIVVLLRPERPAMRITWMISGSLLMAGVSGRLAAASVYPEMAWGYAWVVFGSVLVLSLMLLPLAVAATAWDVAAVVVAGLIVLVIVTGSGFMGAAEVIAPAVVAGAALAILAAPLRGHLLRRRRGTGAMDAEDEQAAGKPAGGGALAHGGALAIALLLPIVSLVAWVNTYKRSGSYAWAMALPIISLGLLWVGRLPWFSRRPHMGGVAILVLVAGVSACGLALALQEIDLRAFGLDIGGGGAESLGDYGY